MGEGGDNGCFDVELQCGNIWERSWVPWQGSSPDLHCKSTVGDESVASVPLWIALRVLFWSSWQLMFLFGLSNLLLS